MKKKHFPLLLAGVIALTTINQTKAQHLLAANILQSSKAVAKNEKSISPATINSTANDDICAKVMKKLYRMHKNVPAQNWTKLEEGYSVKFISSGIGNVIFYDINGNWSGSIKNYEEDKLSYDIKNTVKHKYNGYAITKVEEIETIESNGMPTYVIHLENRDSYKLVRFYDGQVEVKQAFEKS